MQRDYITTDQHVKIQSIDPVTSDEARTKIVDPADDADVELTIPLLSQTFQDTIRFIRGTGCRPGEARLMQVGDLDRETWLFKPSTHKTAKKGRTRAVPIPTRVQSLLLPRLLRPTDAFVFGASGGKRPFERRALGRAIERALKRLNKQRAEKREEDGLTLEQLPPIAHWHPYQLRHVRAVEVREEFDLETAQVILGHSRINMTEHYAKVTEERAKEVQEKLG